MRRADAKGAAKALVRAIPGLCGPGTPLPGGIHLTAVRSPQNGAIARVDLIGPRSADDALDDARVSYVVTGVGAGGAGQTVAEAGARAIADALDDVVKAPVTVVLPNGQTVRVLGVADIDGPTEAGDLGGEITYRVDGTLRMQTL